MTIPQHSSGVSDSPTPSSKAPATLKVKTDICLICGDKGISKDLIRCIQCKACAQHSYCLETLHRDDNETIIWRCEDCAPNSPKCESEQLRKSERIRHATEAKNNRLQRKRKSGVVKTQIPVKPSGGESSEWHRNNDIKKRQPILQNENFLNEEPELLDSTLNMSSDKQAMECEKCVDSEVIRPKCLYYPEFDQNSRAQPLSDPVWTGQFRLNNTTQFQLVAHLSSKACSKANAAVTGFLGVLDIEMLSRGDIWPQSFDTSPPDGESIALYFFPQYEWDEIIFEDVLTDVIDQNRALRAVINNMELLIFSSHLLPPGDRRICTKYYLWGVFKPKPVLNS